MEGFFFFSFPKAKHKPEGNGLRHVGSTVLSGHSWRHLALFFPLLSPPSKISPNF